MRHTPEGGFLGCATGAEGREVLGEGMRREDGMEGRKVEMR